MCMIFKTLNSIMSTQAGSNICIKLVKDSHNIPYLMSLDDCIIFCKTTKKTGRNVKYIIYHYCRLLRQLVNYQKSKIRFSKGINETVKQEIMNIHQITQTTTTGTYLGCSNVDKRTKSILKRLNLE